MKKKKNSIAGLSKVSVQLVASAEPCIAGKQI